MASVVDVRRPRGGEAVQSGPVPEVSAARPAARRSSPAVVAVLPAHNEQASLGLAIASLRAQTRALDGIIVIADNCTDATVEIGTNLGCEVASTVDNTLKKAGALNQMLPDILSGLQDDDMVLVMDADSQLSPEFIETAVAELGRSADLGAVGGVFYGLPGHGLIGQLQRNEYTRYSREISRRKGKAVVLTGTGTVFRVSALRAVQAARGEHPARGARPHLRHLGAHRGQRDDVGAQDAGIPVREPSRLPGDDRDHAGPRSAVEPAVALAARRAREPQELRLHPGHRAVHRQAGHDASRCHHALAVRRPDGHRPEPGERACACRRSGWGSGCCS